MKKILVIDNYDSFTYNLVYLLRELGEKPRVVRNDQFKLEEVNGYDKVLLSPGPGIPSEAGFMPEVLREYAASKSILGVCLGHQAIGEAFGASLYNLPEVVHGLATPCQVTDVDDPLFQKLPASFAIGRYHSWVVKAESLQPESKLKVTATDNNGQIMALRHTTYDVAGLQFHPESILTEHGKQMMENWLKS